MEIELKLIIFWILSLILFTSAGVTALKIPEWMNGTEGLAVRFFLGYCSIIVVAHVCVVMEGVQRRQKSLSLKQ